MLVPASLGWLQVLRTPGLKTVSVELVQRDEAAPPKRLIMAGVLPRLVRFGKLRPLELQKEEEAEQRSGL